MTNAPIIRPTLFASKTSQLSRDSAPRIYATLAAAQATTTVSRVILAIIMYPESALILSTVQLMNTSCLGHVFGKAQPADHMGIYASITPTVTFSTVTIFALLRTRTTKASAPLASAQWNHAQAAILAAAVISTV